MTDPFTDPDRCTQVEDDNPETLAGDPVEFDEEAGESGRQIVEALTAHMNADAPGNRQ